MRKNRRTPNRDHQKLLLRLQGGRCFWCTRPFGTLAYNRKSHKTTALKVTWDHVDPRVYTQSDGDLQFVAACQLCNRHKSHKVFDRVKDCRAYCKRRAKEKKWQFHDGDFPARAKLATKFLQKTQRL